ncbi:MAG: gephyrin-like molybdotransferase Glp [Alphaproteobacteria bacterium]
MISVKEATNRIVAAMSPTPTECIPIGQADGRVLAEDVCAANNQPPFPVSAVDGYAVRSVDVASVPRVLKVIGSAPAGHPYSGEVGAGEAVRIFTGGVIPPGADTIVIQENTDQGYPSVTVRAPSFTGRHIRPAGLDFRRGDVLAGAGKFLTPRDLALIAANDVPQIRVRRRPRVVLAATGDELSVPGSTRKTGGIVASSIYSLSALIERWGGETHGLGILPDNVEALHAIAAAAVHCDFVVTLGGASVGDHDLVQRALQPQGFILDFWKIAMRPGKPLLFGRLGNTPLLGLPGNPVSSYVCALLFLKAAMMALLGTSLVEEKLVVRLAAPLPANDAREDYVRARIVRRGGEVWVEPFSVQDSSMQLVLAQADVLLIREPHAPAAEIGASLLAIHLQ